MNNYQMLWNAIVLVLFSSYINQTWSVYLPFSAEYNHENQVEVLQKQIYLTPSYNHKPKNLQDSGSGVDIIAGEDKSQGTSGSVKPEDYNYNNAYEDGSTYKETENTAALGNWRSLPHGSYDKNDDVVTGNTPAYGSVIWPDQSSIFNEYKNSDAYDGFEGASETDNGSHDSDNEFQYDKDINDDDESDNIDDDEVKTSADAHTLSRKRRGFDEWFIAPHTRWCGRGNIANNTYNELGGAADADRCCRRHDLCPLFISAFSTRFEYFNFRPYTISHCSCDRRFRTCLKMNNDEPSDTIGQVFFNFMPSQCFILRGDRKCVDRDAEDNCLKETTRKRAHVRSNLKY